MKLAGFAVIAALAPFAATAGSIDPVLVDEPVLAPAPVLSYGGDWTGAYAGLSAGAVSVDTDAGIDGDGGLYGGFLGYDYDFGSIVMGAELDYQMGEIDIGDGAAELDSVTRLKLRAGYDAGPALLYLTAGGARADTSLGDADGWLAGVGIDYKITENFTIGAEALHHRFDDAADSGIDVEANTFSLRGAFRF